MNNLKINTSMVKRTLVFLWIFFIFLFLSASFAEDEKKDPNPPSGKEQTAKPANGPKKQPTSQQEKSSSEINNIKKKVDTIAGDVRKLENSIKKIENKSEKIKQNDQDEQVVIQADKINLIEKDIKEIQTNIVDLQAQKSKVVSSPQSKAASILYIMGVSVFTFIILILIFWYVLLPRYLLPPSIKDFKNDLKRELQNFVEKAISDKINIHEQHEQQLSEIIGNNFHQFDKSLTENFQILCRNIGDFERSFSQQMNNLEGLLEKVLQVNKGYSEQLLGITQKILEKEDYGQVKEKKEQSETEETSTVDVSAAKSEIKLESGTQTIESDQKDSEVYFIKDMCAVYILCFKNEDITGKYKNLLQKYNQAKSELPKDFTDKIEPILQRWNNFKSKDMENDLKALGVEIIIPSVGGKDYKSCKISYEDNSQYSKDEITGVVEPRILYNGDELNTGLVKVSKGIYA